MYPLDRYSTPSKLLPQDQYLRSILPEPVAKMYEQTFQLFKEFMDTRNCPHSMGAYDFFGFRSPGKGKETGAEDGKPTHERTSSRWMKVEGGLSGESEQTAAMGFIMDGALAFLPLTFTKRPLTAVSAVSSLDFSLRLFRPTDLTQFHLVEQNTESGGNARTYSKGKMWDEQGREVAIMTQASVMRPKTEGKASGGVWDARQGSRVISRL